MIQEDFKLLTLPEVKNMLKKIEKEREELIYEQKIALEHVQRFSKLSVKQSKDLVKELSSIENMEEKHAYKIADILPLTEDDVKAIFAKERYTPNDGEIKKIVQIVGKYYVK